MATINPFALLSHGAFNYIQKARACVHEYVGGHDLRKETMSDAEIDWLTEVRQLTADLEALEHKIRETLARRPA